MKSQKILSFITAGLAVGLFSSCNQSTADEKLPPEMRSFYEQLTPEAKKKFLKLDQKHQVMMMESVEQSCNGGNACGGGGNQQDYRSK